VLYNTYTQGAYTEGAPEASARQARALAAMIEVGWGGTRGAFRDVFARLFSPRDAGEQLAWWDALQQRTATPEDAARLWRAFNELDVRACLPRVSHPALVAHVRGDAVVPFEVGRRIATQVPGAEFLPLEGDNHVLQPEDPGWPEFVHELRRFLHEGSGNSAPLGPTDAELTPRERALLDLAARGHSNADIAYALGISAKTVRNHVSRISGKLRVHTRSELIVKAREGGFGLG
jgi:DNA-binding CsgD family transcriptional regulator